MKRHEVPTHLNVQDKAFYGLSMHQLMIIVTGLSAAYSLWNSGPALPQPGRIGLALGCVLLALVFALFRPGRRGLEEWLFLAMHYIALPRATVWRMQESEPRAQEAGAVGWEDLAPRLFWNEAGSDDDIRQREQRGDRA